MTDPATSFTYAMYVVKPLVLLTLILAVARALPHTAYRRWVVMGLVWSLAGDVFLMLPGAYFVPGLVAFLIAHLCYIVAFARDGGGLTAWSRAAGMVVVAAIVLAMLWPTLGDLRVPVLLYMVTILTMAWQALARARTLQRPDAAWTAYGALFFVASDTLLAFNKFAGPMAVAGSLVLPTYWVAQWLIARGAVAASSFSRDGT